jgi:hypothetical protein
MKTTTLLLTLMMLALNNCFAFDQSHLPNPPIDLLKDRLTDADPLAWERYLGFQHGLILHGVKNCDDWRVGEFGAYTNDIHGHPVWNKNTAQFWDGAWAEDTNGWRVELNVAKTNTPEMTVEVSFGSVVKNSDDGTGEFFLPPHGLFPKFELKSPDGKILQPYTGIAVEQDCPSRIPVRSYPSYKVSYMVGEIWFVTNGPPAPNGPLIGPLEFRTYYSITNEGDYTLTVRPVLYQNRTGRKIEIKKDFQETSTNYFDRVDLPEVTTKVHLVPNVK